jgi:glycerol-3-phosphate dehydrogenase (NAD(P)+)
MKDAPRVLVIGYGEMGHAMEYLLAGRCDLRVWTRRPVAGHEPLDLATAVSTATVILYCIPVTPLADVAQRVLPALLPGSISLSIAKGLDAQGRPAAQALHDVYAGAHDFGVLYGPMISEEIRAGRPAFAQLADSRPAVFGVARQLFAGTGLSLEYSPDMTGISWASVLKNVYAMLFGAADELGLGDNVRGYLTVACMDEMHAIVGGMGGEPATAQGLAGLGDLVTTATSEASHHHAIGRRLVQKQLDNISGEGVHTLAMLDRYQLVDFSAYPLLQLVQGIIREPVDIGARLLATIVSITNHKHMQ